MAIQKLCIDLGNGGLKGAGVHDKWSILTPAALNDLKAYLASGGFDGIDQTLAERIVTTFGARTVSVIESEPHCLEGIPGIGHARAKAIHDEWGRRRDERDKEVFTAFLPSKVGVGDTYMGLLKDLPGLERSRREEKPIQIVSDDGAYLVGPNVERYAALLERFDPSKYVDSPELRAVTRALLAQMVNDGPSDVALIVALPVAVTMSADIKELVKGIEGWLLGEHRFTYDGSETCIRVHAVRAMPQPLGAFFAWGLDLTGQWARSEDDLVGADVAVLDSGFNTLDLLLIRQGRVEKRFTGGEDLGVRVAAGEIANALQARYSFKPSLLEVDELIRRYLDKGKVTRIIAGQSVDLKPIVKQALNSLATRTVAFVQDTWGNASAFSYVLLAGGGALVLGAPIRRHIPHAQMLPDPVMANAAGLARLAQRPGVFKGL